MGGRAHEHGWVTGAVCGSAAHPSQKADNCIASYCTDKFLNGVIPDNHDIIAFNIWSVVPIWLILCFYLGRRAWTLYGGDGYERLSSIFSATAAILFGVVALALWVSETRRQVFYDSAHLTSAGLMVVILILSIAPFARWIGPSSHRLFRSMPGMLNNGFWLLFWGSGAGLPSVWLVMLWRIPDWNHKVLVIEVFAIVPFAVYWVMQGLALGKLDRT